MDDVLPEAYRLAAAAMREATAATVEGLENDPVGRVSAFLEAGFSEELLNLEPLRVDQWSAALARPEIAETDRTLYQRYREDLEHLLADVAGPDPIRRAQIKPVSDTIMATLDGLRLDWMRRRDSLAVRNGLNLCLLLVRQLLGLPVS